jgi:hypothetical protein
MEFPDISKHQNSIVKPTPKAPIISYAVARASMSHFLASLLPENRFISSLHVARIEESLPPPEACIEGMVPGRVGPDLMGASAPEAGSSREAIACVGSDDADASPP